MPMADLGIEGKGGTSMPEEELHVIVVACLNGQGIVGCGSCRRVIASACHGDAVALSVSRMALLDAACGSGGRPL